MSNGSAHAFVPASLSNDGRGSRPDMKTVPLLDLKAQYATIREEIRAAIDRVCESQHFILGPEVTALEKEVAAFCGASYAIGMSSGTDALLAALMAIGLEPGDEVITTPFTFFATVGAVVRLGGRPIFVDIDPQTFNIDSTQALSKITRGTKAIIPVHLFGQCAEMDPLLKAADQSNLYVIEDAAQAIGAQDEKGRQAGTMGDIGCFSFFPSKNLGAFGDGGMVITNNDELAGMLNVLRVHGAEPKYYHKIVGGNFRLDALQAAILRVKLRYLNQWSDQRRQAANRYRSLFEAVDLLDRVSLLKDSPGHIYHQFVVRFSDRDRLQGFLRDKGIETAVYYPVPLHLQDCFREFGYQRGDFPHSESAAHDSLALPIYPELSEVQQEYVVSQIREFYQQ
jgi:dTDP-4-amino-4,6-dideoxygalactose transaminase